MTKGYLTEHFELLLEDVNAGILFDETNRYNVLEVLNHRYIDDQIEMLLLLECNSKKFLGWVEFDLIFEGCCFEQFLANTGFEIPEQYKDLEPVEVENIEVFQDVL